LVAPFIDDGLAGRIVECVHHLDSHDVRDLTRLLANVPANPTESTASR
jgi:hypothetical protein